MVNDCVEDREDEMVIEATPEWPQVAGGVVDEEEVPGTELVVIVCIDLEGESTEEEVESGSFLGVAVPAELGGCCSIERLDP